MALDVAQAPPGQVVYIENTSMFVQIAEELGIRSILHKDYGSTSKHLAALGLTRAENQSGDVLEIAGGERRRRP